MKNERKKATNQTTNDTQEKLRLAREQALRDLRRTFKTESGQRTLARLRAAASIDSPAFPTSIPTGWSAGEIAIFHQGQRSVILEIEKDLREAGQHPEDGDSST